MSVRAARSRGGSIAFSIVVLASGCASTGERGHWGEHASFTPGLRAVAHAAEHAAREPLTWAPLLTAGMIALGGVDDDWSERLARHAPLFGGDADDASNVLRDATTLAYLTTALAAPDGHGSEWVGNKLRGLQVGLATAVLEAGVTTGLKTLGDRRRPNGQSDKSFPSGHAGQASSRATLAVRNLDYFDAPAWTRQAAAVAFYATAGATGWARVEAEKHYVTDVLAGFAIGHFIAAFMHEAFMEAGVRGARISVAPADGGVVVSVGFRF